MNKDKKIEEMLLERSKQSFEKTKDLKIRSYERDLKNVYSDLHDANKSYLELMEFSKEFGLTDYFQKELNGIQDQISQQTTVAAKTVESIEEMKNAKFTPEMALQQYAYRHEAELKTPRTIIADYEEEPVLSKVADTLALDTKQKLFEEVYDGVESLKEINANVGEFNQSQQKDLSSSWLGEAERETLNESRSRGLVSSARSTQRMNMVKNMNRILDKIDLLNEQQEHVMQADVKPEYKQAYIEGTKDTVQDLKSQYEKLQMQYEDSLQLSRKEVVIDFSPNVTETCIDNLINEAVNRHKELCKEAERTEPEKEKNFELTR